MNREEAREMLQKGIPVQLRRIGKPEQPYLGRLKREFSDGTFLFEGRGGSELIECRVKSEEISPSPKKSSLPRK